MWIPLLMLNPRTDETFVAKVRRFVTDGADTPMRLQAELRKD